MKSTFGALVLMLILSLPLLASDVASMIVGKWTARLIMSGASVTETLIFTRARNLIKRGTAPDGAECVWRGTYRIDNKDHLWVITQAVDGPAGRCQSQELGQEFDWGLVEFINSNGFILGTADYTKQ